MQQLTYHPLASPYETDYLSLTPLTTYDVNGGGEVDLYKIELSIGSTDVWTDVFEGPLTDLDSNYGLLTTGNTLGFILNFRVSAHNIHGWGETSNLLTFVSSSMPEQPDAPRTFLSEDPLDQNLLISWDAPTNNFGQIERYIVKVAAEGTDDFYEEPQHCDGSQEDITTLRQCQIPLALLEEDPYNLLFDSLIRVKLTACNLNGCGAESEANTEGAKVQTQPSQIPALFEGKGTNERAVHIEWNALSTYEETRGAAIISYHVRWDKGTFGLEWFDLIGLSSNNLLLEHTHEADVVPGNEYQMQVRARNKWGWGDWSPIIWVTASTWPADMAKPQTFIDSETGGVIIRWSKPDDHSSEIIRYIIEV
jgi:hypothetical protein